MPLVVNLRHLDAHALHLSGELPAEELDIETRDEVIQLGPPLRYELQVEKLEGGLLVTGSLRLPLNCQCVRCLKRFQFPLEIQPWTCHLPLKGEDAVPVVSDCVDLTPHMREDILLEFPQHPLCGPECRGVPTTGPSEAEQGGDRDRTGAGSPTWAELNKLKLKR